MKALVLAVVAACDARAHVATCADDLGGEWMDAEGHHWGVMDQHRGVEAYPLFADHPAGRAPGVSTAPRALDLQRAGIGLAGTVARRFERGAHACVATAEVHVLACVADTLELVLADPAEPVFVDPDRCTAIRPDSSRRVRWTRVR